MSAGCLSATLLGDYTLGLPLNLWDSLSWEGVAFWFFSQPPLVLALGSLHELPRGEEPVPAGYG